MPLLPPTLEGMEWVRHRQQQLCSHSSYLLLLLLPNSTSTLAGLLLLRLRRSQQPRPGDSSIMWCSWYCLFVDCAHIGSLCTHKTFVSVVNVIECII